MYMDQRLFQCYRNQQDIRVYLVNLSDEPSDWPQNVIREQHSCPRREAADSQPYFAALVTGMSCLLPAQHAPLLCVLLQPDVAAYLTPAIH